MAKILLAGCGDIGLRLSQILVRQGHQVVGLRRNPPISNDIISYYQGDITAPESLVALNTDFDQIFFMSTPDRRDIKAYQAIYQMGLNNLLSRFATAVKRPYWFFISSTSVYGQTRGEWVDEQTPTEPNTATGKIILQAEQRLQNTNTEFVIVRFSGIYGLGRERLLTMAIQTPVIQHSPPYFTNRIHQDDCTAILAFLSERQLSGQSLDDCYLASDDDPAPQWEVITWLAEQLNSPPPIAQVSSLQSTQNKRCRNARLKASGYRFNYSSYREGYLPVLAAFKRSL